MERRIIAIQMLPKAYDEIQRLKGEETWTRFIIQCVLAKVGDNSILQDELASLTKESKAEPKPKKVKAKAAAKAFVGTALPKLKKAKKVKLEAEPGVKYGVVNQKTGGTPVDISKIGRHEADEVDDEIGELVLEK